MGRAILSCPTCRASSTLGCRTRGDDFPHTHINDVGLQALCKRPLRAARRDCLRSTGVCRVCWRSVARSAIACTRCSPACTCKSAAQTAAAGEAGATLSAAVSVDVQLCLPAALASCCSLLHLPASLSRALCHAGGLQPGGGRLLQRQAEHHVRSDGNTFVRQDQVVAYCKALLEVFQVHCRPGCLWGQLLVLPALPAAMNRSQCTRSCQPGLGTCPRTEAPPAPG